MKIRTYIVNLPKSVERRKYMEALVSGYDFLDVEFFDAVYGKELSEEELEKVFDRELAFKRYGRSLEPGEIGCSLSHFGIYRNLIDSGENYCLIFEDDITILKDISAIPEVVKYIDVEEPRVLFLSGDYWWTKKESAMTGYDVAEVYDAVGTYAYFINKAAATFVLKKNVRCANAADNWALFRQQGVKLKAVYPYMIDANIEEFESEIKQSHFGHLRKNMPIGIMLRSYWVALIKKALVKKGHFVSKIRQPRNRK